MTVTQDVERALSDEYSSRRHIHERMGKIWAPRTVRDVLNKLCQAGRAERTPIQKHRATIEYIYRRKA